MRSRKKRRGRQFWTALIEEFEASGEKPARFARRHRVKLGTLRSWLYQLRRERREGRSVRFVEVQAVEMRQSAVEVAYGERTVVRLGGGATPGEVAELVIALEKAGEC